MFTDEELKRNMQEISEVLGNLSDPKRPLTKEEQKRKRWLTYRQTALEGIKEAKDEGKTGLEMRRTLDYSLLTTWGEKHPFLTFILIMRLRGNMLFQRMD